MPSISQAGALNTTALVVPDLYIQIVPPSVVNLNGVPSNVVGMVGTATWGPVNKPVVVGNMAQYAANFGAIQNRKYDMGTHVACAVQQGASNFLCVRVTDGTDVKASSAISISATLCLTLTARYSGSLGNSVGYALTAGSKPSTTRLTVYVPGGVPEVYDNIAGTGATLWSNIAAAVTNGNSTLRGPSLTVAATAGAGTGAPTLSSTPTLLTGGTDGSAITAAALVGNQATGTGMYSLHASAASILDLCDCDDSTQYTVIDSFALIEGMYAILTTPAGDIPATAAATKATAGLDDFATKLMLGDWIYWNDQANGLLRLVSPQGFVAGLMGNLAPNQSSLNKQIYAVVGTQKTGTVGTAVYSTADLQVLATAGIDVITNPAPGGAYFAARLGHNTSSRADIHGDNYTRMTNYIADTLEAGMGVYVGELISTALFANVSATLNNFLAGLLGQGLLVSTDGKLPYSVQCNVKNNPPERTGLGYLQADVQVRYGAIAEYFIVNLQGGQTVSVTQQSSLAA